MMRLLFDYSDAITCLSFQFLKGVGPVRARKAIGVLSHGNNAEEDFVEAVNEAMPAGSSITLEDARRALDQSGKVLQESERLNVKILPVTCDTYPARLAKVSTAPPALWVMGEVDALSREKQIAVVGTRNPTDMGRACCERITRTLTEGGVVIVSGLAAGCDAVAHKACLNMGGVTVAVMPSGLDVITPIAHRELAEEILQKNGALVSEYNPGEKPRRASFVQRNRIQSGLSDAVVVIEAGLKSGTMKTAQFCLDQGRKLYCVSPELLGVGSTSEGNRDLIAGQAASLKDRDDILRMIDNCKSSQAQGELF